MPKFLEEKLKKEYPGNPGAVYGTLNKLGYMKGSKETKKGKMAEKKHEMAKRMKGHVYERTIRGGWEKVRENMSSKEFEKSDYAKRKHKIGQFKGQSMYRLR